MNNTNIYQLLSINEVVILHGSLLGRINNLKERISTCGDKEAWKEICESDAIEIEEIKGVLRKTGFMGKFD